MGQREFGDLFPPFRRFVESSDADPERRFFKRTSLSDQVADRFIPVRSAIDWDFAQSMLTGSGRMKPNPAPRTLYGHLIEAAMYKNGGRLLSFRSRPSNTPGIFEEMCSTKPAKPNRRVCTAPDLCGWCPDILDDYHLNLMDWGSKNIVALAEANSVYLWDTTNKGALKFGSLQQGHPTSVSWSPDGSEIAIGFSDAKIKLFDLSSYRVLRFMHGSQRSRIGAFAWNGNVLSTAGRKITSYDMRVKNQVFQTKIGHQGDVCALKWSSSGRHLASAGADGLIYIWDLSGTSTQWLHRFSGHYDSMKALSWCPSQSSLLACSGGESNRNLKFWDTRTGAPSGSLDTGSQVSEILWNSNGKEFLTSHGDPDNKLILWKYPINIILADLPGHLSRVHFMSQSPDGSMVASAATDQCLKIWKDVFSKRSVEKSGSVPFSDFCFIR